QPGASQQDDVDLFLSFPGVIVIGVIAPVRREPQDVHAEGRHPQAPPRVQELIRVTLELFEAFQRDVGHGTSSPDAAIARRSILYRTLRAASAATRPGRRAPSPPA